MSNSIEKAISRLQKTGQSKPAITDEMPGQHTPSIEPSIDHLNAAAPVGESSVDEPAEEIAIQPQHSDINERSVPGHRANKIALDYDKLHELGFITPIYRVPHLEEEYRVLKRPILKNAFGKGAAPVPNGNLVMITSALPGEGKSFTTLNLAMSMAMEMDSTVLLVDGDVIRASLSTILNVDNHVGLTDLLEGKAQGLEEVIVSTDNPKLKILPSGRRKTYSTELLASDRMARIAKELSTRYPDRIILFDAPPLLVTTEAVVLTHIMGQVLVVVEAGKSKTDEVNAALAGIDRDRVVGLVLNKSRKSASGGYYDGYYGNYAVE
ncbi:MAG: XrtA-associated tyrosine autokinase [Candidatus Polarisedimenticolaceae bacterium]|nr:XrtA-associated tyrosine autokinase [Candidatus Polarisedimenticolaceae bacterium]